MASLSLENVTKSFGKTEVVKGVDIAVDEGEFVVFVGPSGCGKSTLLRIIAGLEDATGGRIVIGDKVVNHASPKERGIAMVFQNYALYPHKTVYENMAFNLKIDGLSRREIREKVTETARVLHMEELLQRRPSQLSGGQRQRVAIGRAIVREPKLFLFDEPLSNLDADLRGKMRSEIAKLHAQLSSTMIYVTHDQVEAMTLADRIVVLDGGVVQQVGTPMELYHNPKNAFVAGFIGAPRMNFFDVEVLRSDPGGTDVVADDIGIVSVPVVLEDVQGGDKAVLGIRPEYLDHTITGEDSAGERIIKGEVQVVERLGHKAGIELQSASGVSFTAIVDGDDPVQVGDTAAVGFAVHRGHLFDAHGRAGHRVGDTAHQSAEPVLDAAI